MKRKGVHETMASKSSKHQLWDELQTTMEVDDDGTIRYYNTDHQLHRINGPAIIWADGTQQWWVNGKRHREDGPAAIGADGTQLWIVNGQIHREDGPAIIWASGTKEWHINGLRHRTDGPAVIYHNGVEEWWENGKCIK